MNSKGILYENPINDQNNYVEYILWIENFTVTHSYFSDYEWPYTQKNISLSDKIKVENLGILYHKIQKYAQKNFIYPKKQYRTEYYAIKYNGVGYKIGIIDEQSPTTYFCERVKINQKEKFIDFKDISQNKNQHNIELINEQLQNLSRLIHQMVEEDVPLEAISKTTRKTLQKIRKRPIK